jgi:hypothetical protein
MKSPDTERVQNNCCPCTSTTAVHVLVQDATETEPS